MLSQYLLFFSLALFLKILLLLFLQLFLRLKVIVIVFICAQRVVFVYVEAII
jgi:hypothetical protein